MKRLTLPAATALLSLTVAGCDRNAPAPTSPVSKATAPPAAIVSDDTIPVRSAATPNDFKRAAKHLDIGGNFLIYWSVDQIIAQASSAANDFKQMAETEAAGQSQKESFEKGWEFLRKLVVDSGVLSIESVSASAIELEPKLFRAKSLVSRKPGAKGLLWEFPGRPPHEIEFLKMLPADTAFVQTLDYDLRKIWNSVLDGLKDVPEAQAEFAKATAEFEKSTGMSWDTYLSESGGEVVLALTLNATNKLKFPVPDAGEVEVAEPGLILAFRVKGTGLFDRIDSLMKDLPHTASDQNGTKIRVGPTGEYEGIRYGPTFAQAGEWLILTSREEIMHQILDASTGKAPGLAQNPEFQRLMKHASAKSNGLSYLGKNLSLALQNFQVAAVQSEELKKMTAAMKKRVVDFLRLPEKLVTVEFSEDGIIVTEVGEAAMPSSSFAGPAAFLVPVAVAGAIPYFLNRQVESPLIEAATPAPRDILNDTRILDAAADQWAIENNQSQGAVIEFETIRIYLKPGSRVETSGGIDAVGNPYIFGKIGDKVQVGVNPATKEFFASEVDAAFWSGY